MLKIILIAVILVGVLLSLIISSMLYRTMKNEEKVNKLIEKTINENKERIVESGISEEYFVNLIKNTVKEVFGISIFFSILLMAVLVIVMFW